MPKLWSETIEAHRREVRDAIMDAAARLAGEQGPLNVTMTQIAQATGIGRATLYKYFDSVEAVLQAWHQRQINDHLDRLSDVADRDAPPLELLGSVLLTYADLQRQRTDPDGAPHVGDLATFLHGDHQLAAAEHRLRALVHGLVAAAADAGQIRSDVSAAELTTYCLHAIGAAGALPSNAAVRRLVEVTLTGLRPSP
ncbi:MAG: TetR/AcrR family transcriptional regulator [Actinobacteria bacterium]|nr:TetR/AcrR family transcriptional regulator [Actinomycetota bacterium]